VKVTDLLTEIMSPPYGLRKGLCPLFLAVFAVIHEQDVAFYDQGCFLKQLTGGEFHRLIKAPENFEIQYCRIAGVRTIVFEHLFRVLHPDKKPKSIDLLDVVRPLCVFAAQLPDFAKKTNRISKMASDVRDALLRAEEPATLLFQTLPEACACDIFGPDTLPSQTKVKRFVERLRSGIEELRATYPGLLQKMTEEVQSCFHHSGSFNDLREKLVLSAARILVSVKDPRLKGFCLRLADQGLGNDQWIESVGSFLCSKPPSKWIDHDVSQFEDELHRCARQYFRVESTLFDQGMEPADWHAMRISITCHDGSELDKVIRLSDGELPKVGALEEKINAVLPDDRGLSLNAAMRVVRALLANETN
jgi:hypothetical protein